MKSKFLRLILSFKTLIILLLIGFQVHNYFMNQQMKDQVNKMLRHVDDAVYFSEEAANYASDASDYAESASDYAESASEYAESANYNSFAMNCSYCPR